MSQYIFKSGEADGKVLTSTEWEQSGRIYLDGKYLSGYTYNRYCPFISSRYNQSRSVTGCTNTADAQVIFYYLEHGVQLDLSVDSTDYFLLSSKRSTRYYLSETSAVGEGTISVLNGILSDLAHYASGDFIAALNFFCGVKNHSTYGESTSTSVYVGTFWDGEKNLKAFRAAGFDSYFSISKTNSLFFVNAGKVSYLTDTGYSIIRENLDYGEPVRVDIPSHSIYLDGYRWNSRSGEYEYHLNYGWGVGSSENRWYTVDEIKDISFDTIGIDLDPKIRVTVMNAMSEYYGGSFLRGVERINHIQNDTRTTFSFVEEIAGKILYLDSINFTSAVDLDFLGWNVFLCVKDGDAVTSRRALSFENQTGGIIVNSVADFACVSEYGQAAVEINLNGGYYYSGFTDDSFSVVKQMLQNFWENEDILVQSTSLHQAVISKDGDDLIRLEDESVIAGGISLCGGENIISIESGSAIYGDIFADSNSLKMNFIAGDIEQRTMVHLAADGENFYSATGGNLYFSVSSDVSRAVYYLVEFQNEDSLYDYSINVTSDSGSWVLNRDNRFAGNFELLYLNNILAVSIGDPVPIITVNASETGWTTENVIVSATFTLIGEEVQGQYSLDSGMLWQIYTEPLEITDNTDIWFQAASGEGDVLIYSVGNIDRIAPTISNIGVTYNAGNTKAFVGARMDDNCCLEKTLCKTGDDQQWRLFTGELEVRENCTVFFRAVDGAGNIAESSIIVDGVEKNLTVRNDVDGNGLSDILMWQKKSHADINIASGVWLIQSDEQPKWRNLGALRPLQYIFGAGKFVSGKTTADIYVYDSMANSVGVWVTDANGQVTQWHELETFSRSTNVLGLGNFDDSEATDLLLQDKNGAVGCYLTDNDAPGWHYFQSLGDEWEIVSIGDFNGDSMSDMVLRNAFGYAGCWLTNADQTVSWTNLDTVSDDISIFGSGDFDGDGTDDILLQRGEYYGVWLVRNGNAVNWFGLGEITDGTVEQIGDFNGDGVADLLVRKPDGELGAEIVMAEDHMVWQSMGTIENDWRITPVALR